ncbi:hypothetical protein [Cytobacillus spongiae]|nr:hypothetical protein [Cytobacillus spongiae]
MNCLVKVLIPKESLIPLNNGKTIQATFYKTEENSDSYAEVFVPL